MRPVTRIMIVDDHDMVRCGVRALLETQPGYEVVGEASDGLEALEVAIETDPDIAIVDYSLPSQNGLGLVHALKKQNPRLEIVMFTFHDEEELVANVLRAGVRGFVLKSEPERHLLDAMRAVSVGRPYFSGFVSETLLARILDDKTDSRRGVLSHREREVVQLIAEGLINKQVASSLDISVKTVETHRANAMTKLGVSTIAGLVRYAVRNNIVSA